MYFYMHPYVSCFNFFHCAFSRFAFIVWLKKKTNLLIHSNKLFFDWSNFKQLMSISADGNDSWIIADIVNVDYISKQLTSESKYQLTKKRILVWWTHLHFFFFLFEMWFVVSCCLCVKVAYQPHLLPIQIACLPEFICLCPVKTCLSHACLVTNWAKKKEQKLKKTHTFPSSL